MRNHWQACLAIGLVSTAIPIAAQTASQTAQALVKGIPDPMYSSVAVVRRANETPPDLLSQVVTDWKEALGQVTGQKFDDPINQFKLAMMPPNFDELYTQGTFQPERAKQYGACIRQISAESLGKWTAALAGDKVSVALQIVRLPATCRAGQLNQDLVRAFLDRLSSVPNDAIVGWSRAQGPGNMDSGGAALNLIAVNQLFVTNKFQLQLFQEALPIAQKSLEEARSKK